jgi:hypothetical protein
MEAWLTRPMDAPDVPGEILEGYARELRESRERLQALLRAQGIRDDIAAAIERSEGYHRLLGLTVRDELEPDPADAEFAHQEPLAATPAFDEEGGFVP